MIIYVKGRAAYSKKKVTQSYYASEDVAEDPQMLAILEDHAREALTDFANEPVEITGIKAELDGFEVITLK